MKVVAYVAIVSAFELAPQIHTVDVSRVLGYLLSLCKCGGFF